MTTLSNRMERALIRPVHVRLPMTEHIPNHWLLLLGGGGVTGILSLLGSLDLGLIAAGILGLGTAVAAVIGMVITRVGEARIKVDRDRLAYEKERSEALDGTLSGKLEHLSEQLDETQASAAAYKELNQTLKITIDELKTQAQATARRLEYANKKLHDLANEANRAKLLHIEEITAHKQETIALREELAKVNNQLADANAQLVALREENARLNRIVQVTAKTTVQNKAAIEATNAKVDRMQQDSGAFVISPQAANEPTVDMPTMADPTQSPKP